MGSQFTERRTQEERRAASRQKLIEAATRLLASRGYAGTTLVEIGKEAGVSHGLVTYHFGTKQGCIKAVLESIRKATEQRNAGQLAELRGLASLDLLTEIYLGGPASERLGVRAISVAMVESISATPDLKPLMAANDQAFRDVVAQALVEAIEDGETAADVDIDSQAVLIVALLRGVVQQRLVKPRAVKLDAIVPAVKAKIRAGLQ